MGSLFVLSRIGLARYILVMGLMTMLGCSKEMHVGSRSDDRAAPVFNLATLKEFSKQRANYERGVRTKGSGINKLAGISGLQNNGGDFNDYLLWDHALEERGSAGATPSYQVPMLGSAVDSEVSDTINSRGYALLDFYSINGSSIYAQKREYRPYQSWLDQLASAKGINIVNNEYLEYKDLIGDAPYNGHILVYNMLHQLSLLATVWDGRVLRMCRHFPQVSCCNQDWILSLL